MIFYSLIVSNCLLKVIFSNSRSLFYYLSKVLNFNSYFGLNYEQTKSKISAKSDKFSLRV